MIISPSQKGKVISYTAFDTKIVIGSDSRLYFYNYSSSSIDLIFNYELKKLPLALTYSMNHLIIGFDKSIQIASVRENKIKILDANISIPMPTTFLCSNGYTWAVLGDSILVTLIYNPETERIEYVSYGQYSKITNICSIDDLSVAIANDKGIITIVRIKSDIAHGFYKNCSANYENVLEIKTNSEICALTKINDLLCYITKGGKIGAFAVCNNPSKFALLKSIQEKIRKNYAKIVGFASLNMKSLAQQRNIVDLEVMDLESKYAIEDKEHDPMQCVFPSVITEQRSKFIF